MGAAALPSGLTGRATNRSTVWVEGHRERGLGMRTTRSTMSRLVMCWALAGVVGCGASRAEPGGQVEFAAEADQSPARGGLEPSIGASRARTSAPTPAPGAAQPSVPAQAAVPPCREAEWTGGTAVDLWSVPSVAARARRLPAAASNIAFTTDSSRLVYPLVGGELVSMDLRRLRSETVEVFGEPTAEGEALVTRPRQSTELSRLSYPSARRIGAPATGVRVSQDRQVARAIAPAALQHRVTWDLLTVVVSNHLLIVDPETQAQRPALPAAVELTNRPTNVTTAPRVAFVARDGRPYVADLGDDPPRCATVAVGQSGPPRPANHRLAVTESGRFLLYAAATPATSATSAAGFLFILVDLDDQTARPLGTAGDTRNMLVAAVGNEERFLIAVHREDRNRMGLYGVDASTGRIRRLGPERHGFTHQLVVSPDGRHVAFQTGMPVAARAQPRPPRPPPPPPPPSLNPDDRLGNARPRLGCDVYGCSGCGWMRDGCGGHQYCGDCPQQELRLPASRPRDQVRYLMRLPPL